MLKNPLYSAQSFGYCGWALQILQQYFVNCAQAGIPINLVYLAGKANKWEFYAG